MNRKTSVFLILFLASTLLTVFCIIKPLCTPGTKSDPGANIGTNSEGDVASETVTTDKTLITPLSPNTGGSNPAFVKGVWVATVYNIDFPLSTNLSVSELKNEIDEVTENCRQMGVNTIFFQVRPAADAFYLSNIFPTSKYLTGTQGKDLPDKFDVLKYFIESAHSKGLALHAWINPLRVTLSSKDILSESNPASKNSYLIMKDSEGRSYFDPGFPEARKIITDGVREIAQNYNVDGIHFDDYFYPDTGADDALSYAKYGAGMTIEDYRRNNINTLIKEACATVKESNKSVPFGVSPQGIWKNFTENLEGKNVTVKGNQSYYKSFSDTVYWMEKGYVDYICPQIYWDNNAENSPFDAIASWWSEAALRTGTDLYIGHAAYKTADSEKKAEFDFSEINRQVDFGKSLKCYKGSVLFSYSDAIRQKAATSEIFSK